MNYLMSLRRYGLLAICIASLPLLTGCILPFLAVGAFTAVKSVQTFAKSTYEVRLNNPTVEDTNALELVTKIALWPNLNGPPASFGQNDTLVSSSLLAELLMASNQLDIVTPFTVSQVLESNSIPGTLQGLLPGEQLKICRLVADKTGADAVFYSMPPDTTMDTSYFSLKRASRTYAVNVELYSKATGDFVWANTAVVVIKQGSTMPSDADMQRSVAELLVKRLLKITGKTAPPQKDTNAPVTLITS